MPQQRCSETGKPCSFTARGCGREAALTPGADYALFVIGQEENNSSLLLTFSDGTRKLCDLKPYLTGEVFGELLDLDKFIQSKVEAK